MLAYLIRRLVAVVVMLLVVTSSPSPSSSWSRRAPAPTPPCSTSASRPTPPPSRAIRDKLGLDDPIYVQYWQFLKGIFAGRDYTNGADVTHCAAPCFGYSFRTDQAVWPLLIDRLPVTLSLALGAAVHLAALRCRRRRDLRAASGARLWTAAR